MKCYLLDSNAVTVLINHRQPLTDRVLSARRLGARIGTCEPVIAELYYGLELSSTRDRNLERLNRGLSQLLCWPLDRRAAAKYGELAASLRRSGRPMQVMDMLLAAIALTLPDCTVITTDSDLLAVPELAVENWEVA